MLEKPPGPGEEYQDWEYPDPKEIEELANLPFDDGRSSSGGTRGPSFLKIVGGFMILAFVGSLLLPVLEPLIGNGNQSEPSSGNTTEADRAYQQWVESSVLSALSGYGGAGQVRFLGVQFGDSFRDPVIGILAEGADLQTGSGVVALQGYSIAVLQNLFADERALSVTLVWLGPATINGSGETLQEAILMVGVLRQTAQGIDWAGIGPADLRYVADFYQEQPPTVEESI